MPDGDTGTNMTLTLESVVQELGSAEAMPEVCQAIAHGSLMGARGQLGRHPQPDPAGPRRHVPRAWSRWPPPRSPTGLRTAADAAYQAVMRPVEGTILTVVRWAAEAAEGARDKGATTLVDLLDEAAAAARQAVAQTPEMLPVLRDAGVVDAGGQGFTLLLDAFLEVVDGRPIPQPAERAAPLIVEAHAAHGDVSALRYEVMYLLDADDATIPAFKSAWASLGDSIVVVGGDGLWNCHVHTDDIGGAVEAGIEAGRPAQHPRHRPARAGGGGGLGRRGRRDRADRARARGHGRDRGRRDRGGRRRAPAPRQPRRAGDRGRRSVDEPVDRADPRRGGAVPERLGDRAARTTRTSSPSPARSTRSRASRWPSSPPTRWWRRSRRCSRTTPTPSSRSNTTELAASVARVTAGEVTQSVRDTVAECGPIRKGDWIAIGPEGICVATDSAAEAAFALVDALVADDSEIVTVLVGADARAAETQRVREHIAFAHPGVELEVHDGGQPLYPYLIGVE